MWVCLGDTVASLVFARLGVKKYNELTEADLLKEARQLVVKSRNKLVTDSSSGPWYRGEMSRSPPLRPD